MNSLFSSYSFSLKIRLDLSCNPWMRLDMKHSLTHISMEYIHGCVYGCLFAWTRNLKYDIEVYIHIQYHMCVPKVRAHSLSNHRGPLTLNAYKRGIKAAQIKLTYLSLEPYSLSLSLSLSLSYFYLSHTLFPFPCSYALSPLFTLFHSIFACSCLVLFHAGFTPLSHYFTTNMGKIEIKKHKH